MRDYDRVINVFDTVSDELITKFPLIISTKKLITIVKGDDDDPELIGATYLLTEQQVRDLGVPEALEVNGDVEYFLSTS